MDAGVNDMNWRRGTRLHWIRVWPVAGSIALLLAGGDGRAAEQPGATAQSRPRIGLVLSGGGARGAAHVGVIETLEKMHVPIDAVAGTSMGAVVGGLYAAGLSGAEIEEVFRHLDWQDLLRDRAQRRDLVYRRKHDDRDLYAPGSLGVRMGEGLEFPLGLVQGQKITQALRVATLPVADVSDFDRLPTPFRALATDLETGEPVVLRSGDLATVLRASMSAPGVLAPVQVEGRLLVDGGLVDNLPVDLARSMGVDVLIVVDVSFPLAPIKGLQSAFDVTNQMIAIMVRRGTLASKTRLQSRDILIEPDIGAMTALEFRRIPDVMPEGARATAAVSARLAPLAVSDAEYERYAAARRQHPDANPRVAFVRPSPQSLVDAARIDALFGDLAGKPLDGHELQRRANRQYGLDRYESVDYRLVPGGTDRGLEIDLRRKSWGPTFLRLGLAVESDYDEGSRANAATELTMTHLNALDAEWVNELQLGEDPRFATEFFQPLSLTNDLFIAPSFRHELTTLEIVPHEDAAPLARYRVRETVAAFAIGAEISHWAEVRVGLRRGDGSTRVLIGDPSLVSGEFDIGGGFVELGYDSLDSVYFPGRGQALRLRWQADRDSLGSTIDDDILEASYQLAGSRGRYSLLLGLDAGTALDDTVNSPQDLFRLGGFLELSGLARDALTGTQYGLARAVVFRRVSRGGTGLFEFPAYLGFSVEAGNTWQTRHDVHIDDLAMGGSVFFGAESPVGPVYLAAGFAEGGERALYLLVGHTF
jgi:NTE family protein